ncbi:MAG: DDE-type integrase/transposase/recombinase, partial [Gallionellaceae bacterium]|nr:DDE-type integrase/transposase/recombinase [Gallionellaceae bacterium]
MQNVKTHYSCAELAALKLPGMPTTERCWRDLVARENWEFTEIKSAGRSGMRREYLPPAKIARLIESRSQIAADGAQATALKQALAKVRSEIREEKSRKTEASLDQIYATLSLIGREKFEAHFDIVLAFREYFKTHNSEGKHLHRNEAFAAFAEDYNAKRIKLSEAARAKYTKISPRSIQRWVLENEKTGLLACADKRAVNGGSSARQSVIEQHPELEKFVLAVLTEKPHIQSKQLTDIINHADVDKFGADATGEVKWPQVSYWAVCRYRAAFEARHAQVLLAETNPDQWKNKYLSSLGKLDADVLRLNQRWEMDGTPADWEFPEGRYNASVVIDLFARRPMILFSKTPRTETNKLLLREAIMEWGVPECAKTDNGTDYKSREMLMFFEEMGIEHRLSAPFSPWEKGHVERFIQTYLHSILEMMDNFIGHSVADRKQIEAKRTFAENLFKKNAVVKVDMGVEEMQRLTNQWLAGTYMVREHKSLGLSPLEKVASYTGSIKRISNERALDILLAKPVKTLPTITKKGIRYDNATFIHADLPQYIGELADIRLDPNDLGKIIVYVNGKFLCIAENPERTGMDRQEVAAHGRKKQQAFVMEKKAEFRAARRAMPMSTQDLVKDLLLTRAEKAGKVTVLAKRVEEHRTAALLEAEQVLKAQENPQLSPEHAQLMHEARQMAAKACNPNPIVIEHPAQSRATPLEGMSG